MLAFFLIIGFFVLAILMKVVPWMFTCTPYALMLLVTLILWTIVDGIHNLIPGHSGLSFLCAAVAAMILTAVLTSIRPIKVALVTMSCSMFMFCVLAAVYPEIKPDSTQYCILVTVGYTVALIANIAANILKGGEDEVECFDIQNLQIRNLFVSIIVGILNAFTVITYILAVREIWEEFWYGRYEGALARDSIFVDNFMTDIVGGYFATERGAVIYYTGLAIAAVATVIASVVFDRIVLSKLIGQYGNEETLVANPKTGMWERVKN